MEKLQNLTGESDVENTVPQLEEGILKCLLLHEAFQT